MEVNTNGLIFNEFDELVGEVVKSDLKYSVSGIINKYNEILDKDGAIVGLVKAIPPASVQKRRSALKKVQFFNDEDDKATRVLSRRKIANKLPKSSLERSQSSAGRSKRQH